MGFWESYAIAQQIRLKKSQNIYNQKIQALNFAVSLAQKTGDWESVQKMVDTNFPEWGIDIKPPPNQ